MIEGIKELTKKILELISCNMNIEITTISIGSNGNDDLHSTNLSWPFS